MEESGEMADINPFRYRGYYYDTETGFYYLQTRYYDPEAMRFINADNYELVAELAQSYELNLYAYCANNPIHYCDYNGCFAITATSAILFLIAGGVTIAYVESETHIIQKGFTTLGKVVIGLGDIVLSSVKYTFGSKIVVTRGVNNDVIGTSVAHTTNLTVGDIENVYNYKRKKVSPRIKLKTKKSAREKAFLKGGKVEPLHHPNGKYGPHFHPNSPKFSHWHYYYVLFILCDCEE